MTNASTMASSMVRWDTCGKFHRSLTKPRLEWRSASTAPIPRRRLKTNLSEVPTMQEFLSKARGWDERRAKARQDALDEAGNGVPHFSQSLRAQGHWPLTRDTPTTLQINIGKFCNLNCRHCHVESGPTKVEENMNIATIQRCIELLKSSPSIDTVDITGGAPELNPHFRRLVTEARALNKTVIDRCNLAVLFEDGQEDLAQFLADQGVNIVASLPCYTPDNTDKQRGKRVFDDSITAIKVLNEHGFGRHSNPASADSRRLDLVYNPGGASLPPSQPALEQEYRRRLWEDHGVTFNSVFTITNMPIKRFADTLYQTGQYAGYMEVLANAFNAQTVAGLMCRHTVNVAWDGKIYDCDFNAALDMGTQPGKYAHKRGTRLDIWDIENLEKLVGGSIRTGKHCYGCTAGSGSSCGGALA